MKLFDVYPLMNVTPVKAKDCILWDENGKEYLDLYGGHAVISIGHSHPHYVEKLTEQVNNIGFYSNSVHIPIQQELAEKYADERPKYTAGKNEFITSVINLAKGEYDD